MNTLTIQFRDSEDVATVKEALNGLISLYSGDCLVGCLKRATLLAENDTEVEQDLHVHFVGGAKYITSFSPYKELDDKEIFTALSLEFPGKKIETFFAANK